MCNASLVITESTWIKDRDQRINERQAEGISDNFDAEFIPFNGLRDW